MVRMAYPNLFLFYSLLWNHIIDIRWELTSDEFKIAQNIAVAVDGSCLAAPEQPVGRERQEGDDS